MADQEGVKVASPLNGNRSCDMKINPTNSDRSRRRITRKEVSPFRLVCSWLVENQVGLSVNTLILLASSYLLFPRLRPWTSKFFTMSYFDAGTQTYTAGLDDLYFVCTWIVIFTGLRAAVMEYILKPFARSQGIVGRKRLLRFAEQGWLFIYDSCSWTLGMYIMSRTPYWFNLEEMWTNFPVRALAPLMKWYYLVQTAFWIQQLIVIHIEERRKDHWQMLTHHVFTNALLICSYGIYQTRVGHVILCIMDLVDIALAFAKMLNYLDYRTACDIAFGVFLVTWFITRHVFYLMVCWSIYVHVPIHCGNACYTFADPSTPARMNSPTTSGSAIGPYRGSIISNLMHAYQPSTPDNVLCFNDTIRNMFLGLLLGLQVLLVIWFGMIVNVAYKVLVGKGADDSRSDDENEDEIEEENEDVITATGSPLHFAAKQGLAQAHLHPQSQLQFQEEEVGVEGLHIVRTRKTSPVTRSKTRRSVAGRASGISIAGHSDHKDLLGRIGCDKPS